MTPIGQSTVVAVYYKSANCNPLSLLLRFVVQLVSTVDKIFLDIALCYPMDKTGGIAYVLLLTCVVLAFRQQNCHESVDRGLFVKYTWVACNRAGMLCPN